MPGFLKILLRNVLDGPSTDPFPLGETFTPDRFRGKVRLDPDMCMGCGICVHTCAAGAIDIRQRKDKTGYDFTVWHNSCCLCASCRHYCPTHAITLTNDWHNAHEQEKKFAWVEHHFIQYVPCERCGIPIRRLPKSIADRIYISNKDVNIDHVLGLCPACRQLEEAERNAVLVANARIILATDDAALETAQKATTGTQAPHKETNEAPNAPTTQNT